MCEHLEGLNKGPQQDPDRITLPQQLDEASSSEQPQETQVQQPVLLRYGCMRKKLPLSTDEKMGGIVLKMTQLNTSDHKGDMLTLFRVHAQPKPSDVVLETGLGLETGLKTNFLCLCLGLVLDFLWSWSYLGLRHSGLDAIFAKTDHIIQITIKM